MRLSAPAVTSPTTPSHSSSAKEMLHPLVKAALANLDIQLESELGRYRRQRMAHKALKMAAQQQASKPIAPQVGQRATSSIAEPKPLSASHQASVPVLSVDVSGASSQLSGFVQPSGNAPTVSGVDDLPATQPEKDSEEGSRVNAPATAKGGLSTPASEEYLESSEELLRSLVSEEAKVRAERGGIDQLLTPVGLGSLLMLLLSSALFGYVVMNPNSLRGAIAQLTQSLPKTPTAAVVPQPSGAVPQPSGGVPQPNLAEQEFRRLDLGSLATLKEDGGEIPLPTSPPATSGKPMTTPTSEPSGTAGSTILATASEPPSSIVPTVPTASTTTRVHPNVGPAKSEAPHPAPRPAQSAPSKRQATVRQTTENIPQSQPQTINSPQPRQASEKPKAFYRVVTDYQNDASLDKVKQQVPDAFVRNFSEGAKIQVGAYDNEVEARAKVEALRQQGISAEIKQPQ